MFEGIKQFYKILGSSDLIGNPIQLLEKLGQGGKDFIMEPIKGTKKDGIKGLAGGIGKGVTSLSTGAVSATFGSVSKITGSLYQITKTATGQKEPQTKPAENIVDGVIGGVKGATGELVYGIAGVITKPIQGA